MSALTVKVDIRVPLARLDNGPKVVIEHELALRTVDVPASRAGYAPSCSCGVETVDGYGYTEAVDWFFEHVRAEISEAIQARIDRMLNAPATR